MKLSLFLSQINFVNIMINMLYGENMVKIVGIVMFELIWKWFACSSVFYDKRFLCVTLLSDLLPETVLFDVCVSAGTFVWIRLSQQEIIHNIMSCTSSAVYHMNRFVTGQGHECCI